MVDGFIDVPFVFDFFLPPPPFGHLPQIPREKFGQLFKFTLRNLGEAGGGNKNPRHTVGDG